MNKKFIAVMVSIILLATGCKDSRSRTVEVKPSPGVVVGSAAGVAAVDVAEKVK